MSFTDQKPFTVTTEHVTARWSGVRAEKGATTHPLFRCAWCGHRFKDGDTARWVFTNTSGEETKGIAGNPFICIRCDGPRDEILARLRAALAEFRADRFWWFRRYSAEVNEAVSEAIRDEQRAAREAHDQGYDEGQRAAREDRWVARIDDASGDVPRCKEHNLDRDWIECEQCGGEGSTEPGELYEMDPLWYDEDDTEPCHLCGGSGGWWSCWECCAVAERASRSSAGKGDEEMGR